VSAAGTLFRVILVAGTLFRVLEVIRMFWTFLIIVTPRFAN
jgi:hypothetical protein